MKKNKENVTSTLRIKTYLEIVRKSRRRNIQWQGKEWKIGQNKYKAGQHDGGGASGLTEHWTRLGCQAGRGCSWEAAGSVPK